jgi:hypothetical protein
MKILFLSYYFEPDLSAGSFRATALIKALKQKLPQGFHIDVVTTQPNRYNTYSSDSAEIEQREAVTIHRVKLPAHKNGFVDQALTFRHYAKFAKRVSEGQKYDLVFSTSSRLMTAVLASYIARRLGSKLYLDIRDIFVDTISDVFPKYITAWAVPIFGWLERYAMRRAQHVNLVSEGFKSYFVGKYPSTSFSYFTNGIDATFIERSWSAAISNGDICRILYAGNMGDGQGLHLIVPELAKRLGSSKYQFRLIGDGGKRNALVDTIANEGLTNVEVVSPVKRDELLQEYEQADILFLHLNDVPAFEKVLPSKLFEYAASRRPMLAGVAGYAATFISTQIENAAVFPPCNVEAAVEAIESLDLRIEKREAFVEKYARTSICALLADDILRVVRNS